MVLQLEASDCPWIQQPCVSFHLCTDREKPMFWKEMENTWVTRKHFICFHRGRPGRDGGWMGGGSGGGGAVYLFGPTILGKWMVESYEVGRMTLKRTCGVGGLPDYSSQGTL